MKNKDLFLKRIKITGLLLFVYIVLANLPIPFISEGFDHQIDVLDMIASINGASNGAITLFSLGLMPYFMSTLVMKLLSQGLSPTLAELSRGTQLQRKRYEDIATLVFGVIALTQSFTYLLIKSGGMSISPEFLTAGNMFGVVALFSGTLLSKYIADKITKHGISNGYVLVISLMLSVSMIKGLYVSFIETDDFGLFLLNILAFLILISTAIFMQGVAMRLPVTVDSIADTISPNKKFSIMRDTFKINIMCVGITPIVYFSFLAPVLALLGIENVIVLSAVSLACLYIFTELSIRSDFNIDRIMEIFLFKGIYFASEKNSALLMKRKLKFAMSRLVVINTTIMFAYYSCGLVFVQVPALLPLNISGISGIQILLIGYSVLDIFYTVRAYFVKEVPEIIY